MVKFERYGRQNDPTYPSDLDFVVVTNEDLGLTATLAQGVNDTFETTIPYPQEWDPDTEVCVLYKMQGWLANAEHWQDDRQNGLLTYLSYLDRSPAATFRGVGTDAEDEWMKSLFAGPMNSGQIAVGPSATAATESGHLPMQNEMGWEYVPEIPLSMFFPIYMDIAGNAATYTLVTTDDAAADFAAVETVLHRYFYRIRRMNSAERSLMDSLAGAPVRWAQLGS